MSDNSRNRVLVVDDDPTVRTMFRRSLELARFDVVVAAGGAEGLQILREDPTIGIVLLDLNMPEMDGWTFLHLQRADARLAAIPTVIVTGSPLKPPPAAVPEGTDYLQKPVSRERLLDIVGAYCQPRGEVR